MIFLVGGMVTHIFVFLPLICWKQKTCRTLPLPLCLSRCEQNPPQHRALDPASRFLALSIDWAVQYYRNTWISGGRNVYNWSLPLWLPAVAFFFFFFCSTTQSTTGRAGANTLKHNRSRLRGGCPALPCSLSLFIGVLRVSPAALQPRLTVELSGCSLNYKHTQRTDILQLHSNTPPDSLIYS